MKLLKLSAFTLLAFAACNDGKNDEVATVEAVTPAKPQKTVPAIASIADLRWLEGRWQSNTPEGTAFENWTFINDSTMSGSSGMFKGKDTMVSETMMLETRGEEMHYIPTVKGQNADKPVVFKLAETAGDSFVFINPGHDFPDKITYFKKTDDSFVAKISGTVKGKLQEEFFPMKKVK